MSMAGSELIQGQYNYLKLEAAQRLKGLPTHHSNERRGASLFVASFSDVSILPIIPTW